MEHKYAKNIRFTIIVLVLLLTSSCALKPIPSEYTFIKTGMNNVELDKLGNGKVLLYNGADILHRMDNTARLNIWIDNKALGQLRGGEYVVVNLKHGTYTFKTLHIDFVNMRSEHEVEVNDSTKIIRIEPTLVSNKLTVTNKLPKKFDKFKYAKKR